MVFKIITKEYGDFVISCVNQLVCKYSLRNKNKYKQKIKINKSRKRDMKITFRVIAWMVLSCTHVMGSVEIIGDNYVAYAFGFIGVVILYERLLMT